MSDPVATQILGKYQFKTPNFTALEEILGQEIQLRYDGVPTIIRIPVKDALPLLERNFLPPAPAMTVNYGPSDPRVFTPRAVFVAVDLGVQSLVPDQEPGSSQKQELVARASRGRDAALGAFRYWLSIVRWKTMNAWFGRDLPAMLEPNAKAYTQDGRFLLSSYPAMKFRIPSALTNSDWQTIAAAIARGDVPPVAYELYFDAIDRLECGDHRRALLEAAMAAEITIRRYLTLSTDDHKTAKRIERARVPDLLEMLSTVLSEPNRASFNGIKAAVRRLSQRRNTLVHTGAFALSRDECEEF